MEVTKIGTFSNEEIETLRQAGTILGAVAKAFDVQDINEVDEATAQLIAAIQEVATRAFGKTCKADE